MKNNFQVQEELQAEAIGIINELKMLEFLGQFGEAKIVGSVAHKLIVKKDIDIHLLTKCNLWRVTFFVLDYLKNTRKNFKIHYEDFRNEKNALFVGVEDFSGPAYKWCIDIWITSKREYTGFDQVEYFQKTLTNQQREIILKIKEYYNQLDMLNDGFSSIIFVEVLYEKIRDVLHFEKYFKKKFG